MNSLISRSCMASPIRFGQTCLSFVAVILLLGLSRPATASDEIVPGDTDTSPTSSLRRPAARSVRLPPAGGFSPSPRYLERFSSSPPETRLPDRREWRDQFNYSIVTVMEDIWQSRKEDLDRRVTRSSTPRSSEGFPGDETSYRPDATERVRRGPSVYATPRYMIPEIPMFYKTIRNWEGVNAQ